MLESVKIQRRQSEIRQSLAELVGKDTPNDDESRSMETLDREYRQNEIRYRAALIAEDQERRDAGEELETRSGQEWAELIGRFEMRQIALLLDEGRQLDGATAEVVQELRSHGGYRGVPIPWAALEKRAGETIASGVPDPVRTMPIIDRIFADSAAVRMGASMISIDHGTLEYPVATAGASVGWATSETGAVGSPSAYGTVDRPLKPDHTMGVQMRITRKALKQTGDALEAAVRRDINGAIGEALDAAVFLGSGQDGEPTGVIALAEASPSVGIEVTPVNAAASWAAFRAAVTRFLTANAANGPAAVKLLLRPEVWNAMDDDLITGTSVSEWDRLLKNIPAQNIVMSSNALGAPGGSPTATDAILTVAKNGVPPIFVGVWGGIDLVRDVYSDAASGALRVTALLTMDVSLSRAEQIQVLTGIQ